MKKKKVDPVLEQPDSEFSIKAIINETVVVNSKVLFDNKLNYSEYLKHPKWQRKRLEIMQRDNFKCKLCNDEDTILNIHHRTYINGRKPWEYENDNLITLCEDCHSVVEFAKKQKIDLTGTQLLKIKNIQSYCEIYYFIQLIDENNQPGFYFFLITDKKDIIHIASFGNRFGSLDKIIEFLLKIRSNG